MYSNITLISFWLSYSISESNFQTSRYFYPYSPSLLPWSVFSGHVSLPSSLPLYQFLQHKYVVLLTLTNLISPSLSFYFAPSLCPSHSLSLSFLSFISTIFSLWVFSYILVISLLLNQVLSLATFLFLSLTIFFFSHLYVTVSFWHSLSVCLCLCVFCCSSTICHSTHSLCVTVTLNLHYHCSSTICSLPQCFWVAPILFSHPHFASLSLALSFSLTFSSLWSLSLSLLFHHFHLTLSLYYSQFR